MRNVCARDFRDIVKAALKKCNPEIKDEDLYFTIISTGYFVDYKPNYPDSNPADFYVFKQFANPAIYLYGNLQATVPTIKTYEDIDDFKANL